MTHPEHLFTYELCAGIVDKTVPLKQIAKEEIDEECGYDVPLERIEKITSFFTTVGISGAKQHLLALLAPLVGEPSNGGVASRKLEK